MHVKIFDMAKFFPIVPFQFRCILNILNYDNYIIYRRFLCIRNYNHKWCKNVAGVKYIKCKYLAWIPILFLPQQLSCWEITGWILFIASDHQLFNEISYTVRILLNDSAKSTIIVMKIKKKIIHVIVFSFF